MFARTCSRHPGDIVILISYAVMGDANRVLDLGTDPAAAGPGVAGDLLRGDRGAPTA